MVLLTLKISAKYSPLPGSPVSVPPNAELELEKKELEEEELERRGGEAGTSRELLGEGTYPLNKYICQAPVLTLSWSLSGRVNKYICLVYVTFSIYCC